jgi:hypothetical protein
MEDGPNGKCFIELLKWRRFSVDVFKLIADDKEEAVAPMSAPCAQSI